MKRGVEFTGPALLAGYYVHLNMLDYLTATDMSLQEMKNMETAALGETKCVDTNALRESRALRPGEGEKCEV